jgi:predicted ATPase
LSTSADQLITDLESFLRSRRLLLALDNFEQVVGAAPLLAGLLAAASGLVVLVTSRAVLRLSGEHEFTVPPLPVPPAGADPDPEELRGYASVKAVHRAGARRGPRLRADRRQRGGGRRDLPPAGRAVTGHRAGRGPRPATAPTGAAVAAG